jgi:CotH kinase protein/Lamin Tail Domain
VGISASTSLRAGLCACLGLAALAAAPGRADVLLNEVNCEEPDPDWIELVNTSDDPADVSGWQLDDDPVGSPGAFVIPASTTIPGHGHVAFVRNAPASFTFGIGCGDTIRLADETPGAVDEILLQEPAVDGDTWGRYPDGTGPWQATLPTQGEPNQPLGPGPDEAAWLYDPSAVFEIDLTLPPSSIDALNADPDEYVPGEFSLSTAEDDYGPLEVGVRLKGGASFFPLSGKAAFKLKFNEFVAGQRFFGLEKLTLNNMIQDPSMLHEVLSYEAFRAAGIPAPRAGYAYVRVNDADYGLYLNLETLDRVSLPRWFDSTQHLYEGEHGTDVTAGELEAFDVDEGSKSDLSDLEALSAAAADTGGDFSEQLASLADLEEMTRMWAVEKYVGQWDGYAGGIYSPALPNNYYLHSDASGVFRMLPWGLDLTLVDRLSFDGAGAGLLFDRCLADPSCKEMFRDAVREVSGTIAGLDLDGLAAGTAALIAPWQALDPRKFYTVEQFQQGVENARAFLAARPLDAAAWLDPPPGPATAPPARVLDTVITDGPRGKVRTRRVKFRFRGSEPGLSFKCRIDQGPFRLCKSPEKLAVGPGRHLFKVRATDRAGTVDPTPAVAGFRVTG